MGFRVCGLEFTGFTVVWAYGLGSAGFAIVRVEGFGSGAYGLYYCPGA